MRCRRLRSHGTIGENPTMASPLDQVLLIAQGFQPAVYLEIHCPAHGDWRLALLPSQLPFCQPGCNLWTVRQIGTGWTKRSLPFRERQTKTESYVESLRAATFRTDI